MANLPEESRFDDGVYQIELTDPVIGGPNGISNRPIRNLVNRTRWLYDRITSLGNSKADKDSPALGGTPTAPTPPSGDNGSRIATTSWVRSLVALLAAPLSHVGSRGSTVHGEATTSEAGFMSASDKDKLNSMTRGAQPNAVTSVAGKTGGVTLSVSDVSGAAPIHSPSLSGAPTAPTPGDMENSARLATTAWVRSALYQIAVGAGFSYSYSNWNGYLKLPTWLGGFIFNWGKLGGSADTITFTYPMAFPNGAVTGIACPVNGAAYRFSMHDPGRTSVGVAFIDRGHNAVGCWVCVVGR